MSKSLTYQREGYITKIYKWSITEWRAAKGSAIFLGELNSSNFAYLLREDGGQEK